MLKNNTPEFQKKQPARLDNSDNREQVLTRIEESLEQIKEGKATSIKTEDQLINFLSSL